MNIISINFACFTVLALFVYYFLPRRIQNYFLLFTSYAFYFTWSWQFPIVLFGISAFNFFWALKLEPNQGKSKILSLRLGIGVNLLILCYFKYANFFIPEITSMLQNIGIQINSVNILLPVGLSFYLLQAISYLVDVYRKQLPAATDPIDFALYMAYFPKLTAGPIERARVFLPKLAQRRIVDNELLGRSFTLIVTGLVRKTVIADPLLNAIPTDLFQSPSAFSAPTLMAWMTAYIFGIYNDFAGYTDIVRGISGFFGINLTTNFAQPFFSRNLIEFWNRWHISLSHWLRDYIYFPISRFFARRKPGHANMANLVLPPLITMLASGFWHGTGMNMLVWGGLMGLYQVAGRIFALNRPTVPLDQKPVWQQRLSMITIFMLFLVTIVPFRMELPIALIFWKSLVTFENLSLPDSRIFVLILPGIWLDFIQYKAKSEVVMLKWPLLTRSFLLAIAMLAIFLSTRSDLGQPFIYQGF